MQTYLPLGARIAAFSNRPLVHVSLQGMFARAGECELCATFASIQAAKEGLSRDIDAVIVDASAGADALAALTHAALEVSCPVAILTAAVGDYIVTRAAAVGAAAVIHETDAPATIVEAMRVVCRGGRYLSAAVIRGHRSFAIATKLTPAEERLLPLACRNLSDSAIAAKLAIAPRTVEAQRQGLTRKLGVGDSAGLVAFGVLLGVVTPSEIAIVSSERRSTAR